MIKVTINNSDGSTRIINMIDDVLEPTNRVSFSQKLESFAADCHQKSIRILAMHGMAKVFDRSYGEDKQLPKTFSAKPMSAE